MVYFGIVQTFPLIYPIVIAVILSLIFHPFVTFFEHRLRFPRPAATIAVIAGFILFILVGLFLIIAEIYQGAVNLAMKIPGQFEIFFQFTEDILNNNIVPLLERIFPIFHSLDSSKQQLIEENIGRLMDEFSASAANFFQRLLLGIPEALSILPNSFTVMIFIILAVFLITNDLPKLKKKADALIPSTAASSIKEVFSHFKSSFGGYLKAQCLLILISAIIILAGLLIIGIDHALTISIIAAVADLIPYIGTGIVFIPWIIYLFITGDYFLTISITIIYMIVIISHQFLEPKIVSSNIGLHPLTALIGMFLGLQLWGIFGIILAPASLILMISLHRTGITKWIWEFIKG